LLHVWHLACFRDILQPPITNSLLFASWLVLKGSIWLWIMSWMNIISTKAEGESHSSIFCMAFSRMRKWTSDSCGATIKATLPRRKEEANKSVWIWRLLMETWALELSLFVMWWRVSVDDVTRYERQYSRRRQ
jgi:hypothetical protein